ncbi:nitrilase-related carbon-nitrogen hydrolase [Sediminispirochaeta bajacaliforniensis]|uniref:nitrilase-related carbon-nitrogen hydrolase n=1 Tax=Sediminispirochaeta bajacaliforniensis TaxID=148 RepID=UPI000363ED92|nr:nitrilase-related carbon-nitrogen hydrolase [Sediminispirochaeta bajacaliforniensis]
MKPRLLGFFFLMLFFPSFTAAEEGSALTIAVCQYEVSEALYLDVGAFEAKAHDIMTRAESSGADLLIIPEYANVMLAFLPDAKQLEGVRTMEEGLALLTGPDRPFPDLKDLFLKRSPMVRKLMDRVWGQGARLHHLMILAGTYFAEDGGRLFNRLVLYGPSGETLYVQDKIHLTPFERGIVELDAGSPRAARLVTVGGLKLGFSICRDTFFDDYANLMESAQVWIDLKANGELYTEETEVLFSRALPFRQAEYHFPWGVTACLNGSFFGLLWQGPSEITRYRKETGAVETVLRADTPGQERLLFFTVRQ